MNVRRLATCPLLILALFITTVGASASSLAPHDYAMQRLYAGSLALDGGYFNSVNADDISTSDSFPANNTALRINKEMWLVLDANSTQWIELGSKIGYFPDQSTYCSSPCVFWEIGKSDGSVAFGQLPDSMSGPHNFEIAYGSSATGYWDLFVDGVFARHISSFTSIRTGNHIDVGIENSDTDNTFVSNTYANSVQFRYDNSGTEAWSQWDSVTDENHNFTGWFSTFFVAGGPATGSPDPSTSTIQYTHG